MITGAHTILYTPAADDLRAFFTDVLEWNSVDAGGGWLIFAMPPGELAVHPADTNGQELYLMCDDLDETIAALEARGVQLARPVQDEVWGRVTAIQAPGGVVLGLYQPKHPVAITLGAAGADTA